jgi:hypothetical protein
MGAQQANVKLSKMVLLMEKYSENAKLGVPFAIHPFPFAIRYILHL